ncbi:hypothetical protein HK102_002994 [Quaeritorhiza haematococci]|nr:hypothetical protein HK102_002994 [Quaeritorhiza haematococci]
MSVSITWKGKKFDLYFDDEYRRYGNDRWPNHVTLKQLLERCSAASGVAVENIKLLTAGGNSFADLSYFEYGEWKGWLGWLRADGFGLRRLLVAECSGELGAELQRLRRRNIRTLEATAKLVWKNITIPTKTPTSTHTKHQHLGGPSPSVQREPVWNRVPSPRSSISSSSTSIDTQSQPEFDNNITSGDLRAANSGSGGGGMSSWLWSWWSPRSSPSNDGGGKGGDDVEEELVSGSFVVMKNPSLPLSKYGIKNKSKIMMIGDNVKMQAPPRTSSIAQQHANGPSPPATASSPSSSTSPLSSPSRSTAPATPESAMLNKLETAMTEIRSKLVPMIEQYSEDVVRFMAVHSPASTSHPPSSTNPSNSTPTPKQLRDKYAQVSELLMQNLLKIDGVTAPPNATPEVETEIRARRREAVKMVQGLMDRVDGLRERVNGTIKEKGLL